MNTLKERLEALGYVIRKEVQYWSCEHKEKKVYDVRCGELEEVCAYWWEQFESKKVKSA